MYASSNTFIDISLGRIASQDSADKRLSNFRLDGCFDGFHYAHANAIRQALFLIENEPRPRIFAGIHADKEILKNKGPPLFDQTERYALIRGCRWIDEVVEDVPYVTRFDVTRGKNIDFVVHGDDIVLDAEGNDCYAAYKAAGKYLECKRTEGISTTSLIQRLLLPETTSTEEPEQGKLRELLDLFVAAVPYPYAVLDYGNLLCGNGVEDIRTKRPAGKTIKYIGGSWDCFGAGHVELLRRAKEIEENGVLIVGLWTDQDIQVQTGARPLLTLLERALAITQCKYTDGIILSVPMALPEPVAHAIGIELVVNSTSSDAAEKPLKNVSVAVPQLQDIPGLRKKLMSQRKLYEERQMRKGMKF
ncbi:Nucleotidylyl transferase [Hysterangium stoloniferum]|nr:Nucleotidylyl transferase [Hysterangium stoloniferum]